MASPGLEQMHTSVLEWTRVSEQSFRSEVWIGPLAFAARSRAGSSTKGKQRTSSIHEVVSLNILLRSDTVARGRGDEARVCWSGPELS